MLKNSNSRRLVNVWSTENSVKRHVGVYLIHAYKTHWVKTSRQIVSRHEANQQVSGQPPQRLTRKGSDDGLLLIDRQSCELGGGQRQNLFLRQHRYLSRGQRGFLIR